VGAFGFVAAGVILLFAGSEALLRGGIGLSKAIGLSPILVGLLVVSLSTASPELSVALQAVLRNAPDIAIADVVGSNIINLLLILGVGALIAPLPSPPKTVFRDGIAVIAASAALAFLAATGRLTRVEGFALLGGFVLYAVLAFVMDWRRPAQDSEASAQCRGASESAGTNFFMLFLGLVAVVFGARCLLGGALAVGTHYHLTHGLLGLTVIAAATALPEFVLMISMAVRGWSFITVGHLLASSIFNILFVLGLTAVLHPFAISPTAVGPDVYILLGVTVLLFPLMVFSWRLSRADGVLLFAAYIAYGAFLAARMGYLPMTLPHF